MKKIALVALASALIPTLVSAQGTINFGTTDPNNHKILVQATGLPAAGTTASLFWSPNGVVPYTAIASGVAVSASSGRITAGAVTATTGAATVGGTSAFFLRLGRELGFKHQWPDAKLLESDRRSVWQSNWRSTDGSS